MGKISQTSDLSTQIENGLKFLEKSCKPITGFQNNSIGTSRISMKDGFFPEDIFTSMNALDILGDSLSSKTCKILRTFIAPEYGFGSLNFNKYTKIIPDDVEDTAFYHWLLVRDGLTEKNDRKMLDVSRLIFLNRHSNGVIQLYISPMEDNKRDRLDAGCLSNTMRFLYYIGADNEALKTEEYLYDWLVSKEYLKGTRYYPSPDTFLYFCTRAVTQHERPLTKFKEPLYEAIKNRFCKDDCSDLPLDLALRILAIGALGKINSPELKDKIEETVKTLREQQDQKGAWPRDALYKLGQTETYLGGDVVSTIFAVAALKAYEKGLNTSNSN